MIKKTKLIIYMYDGTDFHGNCISGLILQDLYRGDDWDLHCLGPHTQGDTGWTGVYIYTGDNQLPRPSVRCCFLIGRFGTYGQREGTLRRITCRVVHVYTWYI